ncbi:hypothetical protein D3C87_1497650 [compost metagenome]
MLLRERRTIFGEYLLVFPIGCYEVQVIDINLVAGHQHGIDRRRGVLCQVGDGGEDPVAQVRGRWSPSGHAQVAAGADDVRPRRGGLARLRAQAINIPGPLQRQLLHRLHGMHRVHGAEPAGLIFVFGVGDKIMQNNDIRHVA